MTEREPKSLQELNLMDRFLFDEVMDVPGMYQIAVNILLENNVTHDSCLILIAPFDLFGRGLYRYTFCGVCQECPDLKIEDGALRVFINTKGTNCKDFSQEFLDFMNYLMATTDENAVKTSSDRVKAMHGVVQKIRASEEMGIKYMQKWEERAYDRLEARAEGKAEGKAIINMLNQALIRDNRQEDLIRSAIDQEFQEELLREYRISV